MQLIRQNIAWMIKERYDAMSNQLDEEPSLYPYQHLDVSAEEISSYEGIYEKFSPELIKYATIKLWPHEDNARDLVQDAFVKGYENRHTFVCQGPGSFFSWHKKILKNLMFNHWKRQNRRSQNEYLDGIDYGVPVQTACPESDYGFIVIMINLDREQLYGNAELSKRESRILHLTDIEEMKPREIAEKLNLTPEQVSRTLYHARNKMRSANLEYSC